MLLDNEQLARDRLRQLLAEVADVVVVGQVGEAIAARETIVNTRPDVVFRISRCRTVRSTARHVCSTSSRRVGSSAAPMCQAIVDDVRRHAQGTLGDDLTLLVLNRLT